MHKKLWGALTVLCFTLSCVVCSADEARELRHESYINQFVGELQAAILAPGYELTIMRDLEAEESMLRFNHDHCRQSSNARWWVALARGPLEALFTRLSPGDERREQSQHERGIICTKILNRLKAWEETSPAQRRRALYSYTSVVGAKFHMTMYNLINLVAQFKRK